MAFNQQSQEKIWIEAACAGDIKAFEMLILSYENKIYNICLRLLKEQDLAYDAAQEVCIKIWKQLKNFKGESKLGTWIYRIATNTCLDLLRQQKRRQVETFLIEEQVAENEEQTLNSRVNWEDLSTQLAEKEEYHVLWQGIQELKPDYRIMIVLRDIEGYSYEEIAAYLGISIGTVKSRLSRARMGLRKILEQNKEPYHSFFRHNKR